MLIQEVTTAAAAAADELVDAHAAAPAPAAGAAASPGAAALAAMHLLRSPADAAVAARLAAVAAGGAAWPELEVWLPFRDCSPCHLMPYNSRKEGSIAVDDEVSKILLSETGEQYMPGSSQRMPEGVAPGGVARPAPPLPPRCIS
jgi:hypothetical protein